MEEEGAKKSALVLDWDKLLSSQDEDVPPPVLIVKPTMTTETPKESEMGNDQSHSQERDERFELLSDHELKESIRSKRRTLEATGSKLPDKGEKLRAALKLLDEEMEWRKLRRVDRVLSF